MVLISISAFAQWGALSYYDMMGSVVAYVVESLSPTQQLLINGITVDGCTYVPDGGFVGGRYVNWSRACNQHDLDYADLTMSKQQADRNLYNAMIAQGAPRWLAQYYYDGLQMLQQAQRRWEEAQARSRANRGY